MSGRIPQQQVNQRVNTDAGHWVPWERERWHTTRAVIIGGSDLIRRVNRWNAIETTRPHTHHTYQPVMINSLMRSQLRLVLHERRGDNEGCRKPLLSMLTGFLDVCCCSSSDNYRQVL